MAAESSYWMPTMKCFVFFVCLSVFAPNIVGEVARPRGTPISKASLYTPKADFVCLDRSATIPYDRINDDFCDCKDGSDEPGTAACPNGSFHCTNAGYRPKNIPSSWVNDGICDCCDGTDEYDGGECENNCKELGKAMREEAEKMAQLLKEGFTIYQEYVQRGHQSRKEKEERKVQLEKEQDALDVKRAELEVAKEEAEKPETEAKDKHKAAWEEELEKRKSEKEAKKAVDAFNHFDVNQDSVVTTDELTPYKEFDIDSNGEVSYEEAKEYLEDNDKVDQTVFTEKVWPNIKEIVQLKKEPAAATGDDTKEEVPPTTETPPTAEEPEFPEIQEGYPDEDEEVDDEDDHEEQDVHDEGEPAEVTEEADQMPEYDEATKALIAVADKARQEFNEVERQFKEVQSEVNELKRFLELDLGANMEYYPLKGECYEFTDREYVYKLCPFERATQRSKNGGSETSLGSWGRWVGEGDKKYSAMLYEKGQNCWNGPDRSVKVLIQCGKNNEILSAAEPNRCEYQFTFTSPAACSSPPPKTDDHDEL